MPRSRSALVMSLGCFAQSFVLNLFFVSCIKADYQSQNPWYNLQRRATCKLVVKTLVHFMSF